MSRTRRMLVAPVALGLAATLSGTAAGAPCTPVRGVAEGYAVPVTGPAGQPGFDVTILNLTGPLGEGGGSVSARLYIESGTPGGVLKLGGTHRWTGSDLGTLVAEDRVVVTPSGVVNNTQTIVSGGRGTIHTHGSLDAETGDVRLTYTGVVC